MCRTWASSCRNTTRRELGPSTGLIRCSRNEVGSLKSDEWFIREVERGLAQIEPGEVLTHETVGARLEKRLNENQLRF